MGHIRLNAQDEYFLDSDSITSPTHVGGLEIFRLPEGAGRDYMQKLHAFMRNSPVRAEPFNYKLVTIDPEGEPDRPRGPAAGRPRPVRRRKAKLVRAWARLDRVNPDEHLYLHALPRPGGQRELGELVARLHVNRLDRSRPLWEVHLIEGLEGGRFAVYTKIHHSQFDGRRGMALNQYVRTVDPAKRGMPPVWAIDLKRLARNAAAGAKAPAKAPAAAAPARPGTLQTLGSWGRALKTMADVRKSGAARGVIAPYSAPATILNGPLTARRRIGTQSLSIVRMKALGAAVPGGATVNEILLAVCGGALRRYLRELDALPDKPLVAACPVAQQRKDDAAAGNAVGQILVSLATDVADPQRRLLAVVASSRANKGLMKEVDPDVYTNYTHLSMLPQILAARTKYGHRVLNANLVISNVPGPRETQYVNGARLEAMYSASMLLAGQALNITVCNFGDNLDIGIVACPDLCPSPQKLAVYAGEELEVLERALRIGSAAAQVRAGAARPGAKPARSARRAPAGPRRAPPTQPPARKRAAKAARRGR